jgi:hypothetical protein
MKAFLLTRGDGNGGSVQPFFDGTAALGSLSAPTSSGELRGAPFTPLQLQEK